MTPAQLRQQQDAERLQNRECTVFCKKQHYADRTEFMRCMSGCKKAGIHNPLQHGAHGTFTIEGASAVGFGPMPKVGDHCPSGWRADANGYCWPPRWEQS